MSGTIKVAHADYRKEVVSVIGLGSYVMDESIGTIIGTSRLSGGFMTLEYPGSVRRIYLTGGRGFIGTRLQEELERTYPRSEVVCIPHAEIEDYELLPFDQLYFLSSYGNLHATQTEDVAIWQANVGDLIFLLEKVKTMHFESFVYCSSSSVTLPTQIMYSRAKRAGEEIVLGYREKYNLPLSILRPYSVTGVGEQAVHLIPTLIKAAYTGTTIPFVKEPVHDFVDVGDVAKALIITAENNPPEPVQCGTGYGITNDDVAKLVSSATGKEINTILEDSLRPYDTTTWNADPTWLKDHGWKPQTLATSITQMVQAYKKTIPEDA